MSDRSLTGTEKLSCQTHSKMKLNAEMKVNDYSQNVQKQCLDNDQPTQIRFNSLDLEVTILLLMLTVVLLLALSHFYSVTSKHE